MNEPDETGFDDRLRRLAGTLIADDTPDRTWCEDSLFRALQTYAAIKGMRGTADDLAVCEALGTIKAREYASGASVF